MDRPSVDITNATADDTLCRRIGRQIDGVCERAGREEGGQLLHHMPPQGGVHFLEHPLTRRHMRDEVTALRGRLFRCHGACVGGHHKHICRHRRVSYEVSVGGQDCRQAEGMGDTGHLGGSGDVVGDDYHRHRCCAILVA